MLAQLEGTQTSHSEEISEYKEQLDSQKQLVATLDQKVHDMHAQNCVYSILSDLHVTCVWYMYIHTCMYMYM